MLRLFVLLVLSSGVVAKCVNEEGEARSWFLMLKMPGGYDYLYADNVEGELKKGSYKLTDKENPAGRVLEPIYSDADHGTNFIVYNDQVPDGSVTTCRGHTKGAVIWNDDSSIQWLIHSVPNFPPQKEKGYSFPATAERFGQSILCIDMEEKALGLITEHLYYTWPMIYNSSVSEKYTDNIQYLDLVLHGKHVKGAPWVKIQEFETAEQDMKFTAFAKTGEFGSDLYKDVIAPHLQENMYTETWQNGRGRIPSNCSGDTAVYNNVKMKLLDREYTETQDHSKWAVTDQGHLCVGGINRMSSQFTRGGGSLCFKAGEVWKQMLHGIQLYEECQEHM